MIPYEINFYPFRCLDARKTLLPEDNIQVWYFFFFFFFKKKKAHRVHLYTVQDGFNLYDLYARCYYISVRVCIYIYTHTHISNKLQLQNLAKELLTNNNFRI